MGHALHLPAQVAPHATCIPCGNLAPAPYLRPQTIRKTDMDFPEELLYTKDHEWVRLTGDVAEIGITEFAQHELGDIVFIDVNTVGQHMDHEAVFGTVEAVKTVSDLYMPVSGEILELNADLDGAPELVNNDPYTKGWMIRVRVANPNDRAGLLSAGEYKELVGVA